MTEKRVNVWVQQTTDRKFLRVQWFHPETGKRCSMSAETDNPDKAEKVRADKEYELNHGLHKEPSRMTWERFRDVFEAEFVAARRQNTRENYEDMLDLFERLCHPKTLRGITERTLSQFAAGMRKEPGRAKGSVGQMPSTIHQRLGLLRTTLTWAVRQKLLPEVPEFPKVKVPKKKPQPVPLESFEKLLDKALDEQMRAYLLCGWLGGLCLNEAFCLEREATDEAPYLDPGRNRIVLPAKFVKADEDQWVPLDPDLWTVLNGLPRHESGKVFHFTTKRGRPVTVSALSERVIRLAKKCGVKLTMHSLRRGFGCHYAGKVPAQVLQKLMRHSNIATTMAFYANVDDAAMQAVLGAKCTSKCTSHSQKATAGSAASTQNHGAEGYTGDGD